jgi:hypothetical protein
LTDFMNLKIKSSQSFVYAHKDRVYICIFIDVSNYIYIYMNIYVCTMFFLKKMSYTTLALSTIILN